MKSKGYFDKVMHGMNLDKNIVDGTLSDSNYQLVIKDDHNFL